MGAMKYLVLRRTTDRFEGVALPEAVPARRSANDRRGSGDVVPPPAPPFTVELHDLEDDQVNDALAEDNVEDVIPSIPFTLINPRATEAAVAAGGATPWGIEAVGAHTSALDGRGVTVAVLDTGINTDHPAFAGRTFAPDDLMDFVSNEAGVGGSAVDDHGHGTHVCGTILGQPVAGIRIGVAPGISRLVVGRVLGPGGGGNRSPL